MVIGVLFDFVFRIRRYDGLKMTFLIASKQRFITIVVCYCAIGVVTVCARDESVTAH